MALVALKRWPRNTWPATAPDLVTDLARRGPNEHTKELAAELSAHAATSPAPDRARDE